MRAAQFGIAAAGGATGWLIGLALQMQQRELWLRDAYLALGLAAVLTGLAGLVSWAWWRRHGRRRPADAGPAAASGAWADRWRWVGLVTAVATAAFASTGWRAHDRVRDTLPPSLEGRDLRITGVVASLPQVTASGVRFVLQVERARWGDEPVELPRRVLLGWYAGFHEDATGSQPQHRLKAGQRWSLDVRLRRPHGNFNPHGFDFERYLFERGIGATGYVRSAPPQVVVPADGHAVLRARQAMRDAIERRLGDTRAAGVLAALSLGDQSAIERDDWDLFRAAGIAHLMSISGLHVTMFAWLVGLAAQAAWRRAPRLTLAMPAPVAGALLGLAASLAYAVFAGWGVPAQRTVWMLAAVTLLTLGGRRWPWPLVLLAAALVVTVLDPWAVLDAGFWLSFAAVGLLMASNPWASRDQGQRLFEAAAAAGAAPPRPWRTGAAAVARAALRTQVVATLGLAPLTLVLFRELSLVGFLANLVAVPWVTLVVTPLALLGALLPPLWTLGAWAVEVLTQALQAVTGASWAVLHVPAAPWWVPAAALLGGLVAILPWPWRYRLVALPLIAPLLWPPVPRPAHGEFEAVVVDVGQGTAVIVRTRHRVLVYDAGPQYSRDSDAGERVLVPLLRARGDGRVDRLVLSHRDVDHVGGAASMLRSLPVAEVLSSLEPSHPLRQAPGAVAARHSRCEAGQAWEWDGVRFEVLHPLPASYERSRRPNALSCVLRVTGAEPGGSPPGAIRDAGGGASDTAHVRAAARLDAPAAPGLLLTGDIEREQELDLLARHGASLASTVLLVPHHGSRTSSTSGFIEAVNPTMAVVQAGYRSRFGHPAAAVLERYRDAGVAVYASPACGAWRWHSREPAPRCEREAARRYWHHPGDGPHRLP